MTHIANARQGRGYNSRLREEQATETRARILDAALRVMAGGVSTVSIPAVAREAGVSVPTVYRHFATKRDLLVAVYPHLVRRAGLDQLSLPRTLDELREGVRAVFERLDRIGAADELARAAMTSPASEEARRASMPERQAMTRRLLETSVPNLSTADRDRIARLLVILTTSSAFRVWREHLGSSVDEAADDVDWIVRACIAAATAEEKR